EPVDQAAMCVHPVADETPDLTAVAGEHVAVVALHHESAALLARGAGLGLGGLALLLGHGGLDSLAPLPGLLARQRRRHRALAHPPGAFLVAPLGGRLTLARGPARVDDGARLGLGPSLGGRRVLAVLVVSGAECAQLHDTRLGDPREGRTFTHAR